MAVDIRTRFCSQHFRTLPHREREAITLKAILHRADGSLPRAAQALGITVFALLARLRQHNIVTY